MKEKLIFFIVIIAVSILCAVIASERKTIICSNINNTCTLRVENILTKSKKEHFPVRVFGNRSKSSTNTINSVDGFYLKCDSYKKRSGSGRNSSTTWVYQLIPFSDHASRHNRDAINEYSSSSACRRDERRIERYFNSAETSNLVYKVPVETYLYFFYFASIVFAILGVLALVKGKVVGPNQICVGSFTPEQEQAADEIRKKMMSTVERYGNVIDKINKFNK